MIEDIRNCPINMTVVQAGPDDSYYVALMHFQDFLEMKKMIVPAGKVLVTWEPAPIVKSQRELAQGEKPAKDRPDGWPAWVITNNSHQYGSDLVFFLKRPSNAANKYKDKAMPSVVKPGSTLKSQMVYLKIDTDVRVTKRILGALNILRFKYTKGDPSAEVKRAIICGADQTIYRIVDILEVLSEAEIAGFVKILTSSQEAFIARHYRQVKCPSHQKFACLQDLLPSQEICCNRKWYFSRSALK